MQCNAMYVCMYVRTYVCMCIIYMYGLYMNGHVFNWKSIEIISSLGLQRGEKKHLETCGIKNQGISYNVQCSSCKSERSSPTRADVRERCTNVLGLRFWMNKPQPEHKPSMATNMNADSHFDDGVGAGVVTDDVENDVDNLISWSFYFRDDDHYHC